MSKPNKPQFARLPWYPRDFASATEFWPLEARAVYRELLDAQWNAGGLDPGVLPDDEEQLRLRCRATPSQWKIAWPYVERKFRTVPGGRQNPRLEEHRQDAVGEYLRRRRGAQTTNRKLGRANGSLSDSHSDTLTDSQSDT